MAKQIFKNWITDAMIDEIKELEGIEIYGADLGYRVFERANIDGSYTCNAWKAEQWIKKYFSDLGEIVEEIKNNLGAESVPNVFDSPEIFQVVIMLECSQYLISQCELVDEHWNDEIELTPKNIRIICQQLREQKTKYDKGFYN